MSFHHYIFLVNRQTKIELNSLIAYVSFFQMSSTALFLFLLSFVTAQLDLPGLRESNGNGFGRQPSSNELDYRNILARLDFLGAERCSGNVAAQWGYETDVNEYTQLQAVRFKLQFVISSSHVFLNTLDFRWKRFLPYTLGSVQNFHIDHSTYEQSPACIRNCFEIIR